MLQESSSPTEWPRQGELLSVNLLVVCLKERKAENSLLYLQGSYWTMDGPAEENQVRGHKRPYPEEDVCGLIGLTHSLIN